MDKDFKKCLEIIEKWEKTPPVNVRKANSAVQDMKEAALETLSITAVLVLLWTLITVVLYF